MKVALIAKSSLAAAALLAAVLAINVWRSPSRQIAAAPDLGQSPDSDVTAAVERLAGALRIQTISFPEESGRSSEYQFVELHGYLEQSFPAVHTTLQREVIAGHSLLYTWRGRRPELQPILLLAHQDVVPVEAGSESRWTYPPFAGRVAHGFAWGRGAMDDKASLMAILEAAESLLRERFQPERTLYFTFSHDEELGGLVGGAALAATLRARAVRPEFILDEGPFVTNGIVRGIDRPVAVIGTAYKGYVSVELAVEAPGGHTSMPPPHTAIGVLSAAIARLESAPMPARLDGTAREMFHYLGPEMPLAQRTLFANLWLFAPLVERRMTQLPSSNALIRTTAAVTIFQGGIKDNMLPRAARAVVMFRIAAGDSIESVMEHARRAIGDDQVRMRILSAAEPSPASSAQSRGFRLLASSIRTVFERSVVAPGPFIAVSDARHYRDLSADVYHFIPLSVEAADIARFHGSDERVAIADYARCVEFYRQLMRGSQALSCKSPDSSPACHV